MNNTALKGKKVAPSSSPKGFEQVELTEPKKALDDAGAETRIVSPGLGGALARQVAAADQWSDQEVVTDKLARDAITACA